MSEQPNILRPGPAPCSDADRLEAMLIALSDRSPRPLMTGALIGCVVGYVGALNETDFPVLALGLSATFLAFFLGEAALTGVSNALRWLFVAEAEPDASLLIAATRDWTSDA